MHARSLTRTHDSVIMKKMNIHKKLETDGLVYTFTVLYNTMRVGCFLA